MQLVNLHRCCPGFTAVIRLLLVVALTTVNIISVLASDGRNIRLVVSSDNAFASDVARQLQRIFEQEMPALAVDNLNASALTTSALPPARLFVTIGDGAWRAILASGNRDTPIIAVMPQRSAYESISKQGLHNVSVVYLDQPLRRWLNLVSLLKPDTARIGIVLGPDTAGLSQPLLVAAAERKQQLFIASVNNEAEVGRVLDGIIRNVDLLLAIPDTRVHTANTVQPILLMSYQAGIPVIGYSASYQRAGAMVALYSTPEQFARQAAEVVTAYLEGKVIPVSQEAKYFSIGINTTVARSLGLALPDNASLEQKLRLMKE